MKNLNFTGQHKTRSIVHQIHRIALAALACTLSLAIAGARADIVAVVSSKSQVTALSKTQIMDIFLGRRTRFPDGTAAIPIDQAEGSAAREEFYARLADMSPAQLKAFWARIIFTGRGQPPKTVASGAEAKRLLIADPTTIGYIDQSLVDSSVRVVLAP
jgi:ABC-type phosphate transport system substrate-binding protein